MRPDLAASHPVFMEAVLTSVNKRRGQSRSQGYALGAWARATIALGHHLAMRLA